MVISNSKKISLRKKIKKEKSVSEKNNKKIQSDPLPEGICRTLEEVASHFSVSVRSVGYWKRDGMPARADGTYDIREIQDWKFKRSGRTEESDEKKGQLEFWQTFEREQKAKKAELDLKKLQGDLISRHEVEQGLIDASMVVKRALMSLPREIVPKILGLNPKQIEMKLMERVKEIIQSFADETAFIIPKKNENSKEKAENLD